MGVPGETEFNMPKGVRKLHFS